MHLKGEMRNGKNSGLSAEPLFSHISQTQRLYLLPGAPQLPSNHLKRMILSLFPSKSENFL